MTLKKVFTCMCVLMLGLTASAQVPQSFSYQGVARNSSGQSLVNQAIGVQFSIIKTSASGTIEYTETHNTTTNTYGLFTLNVGGGTPVTGTFAGIDWSQGPKFLKVEIDPAGGTSYTHIGTTQLLSVPYAQYAGNGDKTVTLTGQGGVQVSGTYPNFTINDNTTLALIQAAQTGSYTGRVRLVDQFNKFMPDFSGVTVKLDSYAVTTNAKGVFLFNNIPEGVYDLEISKSGYNIYRAQGAVVMRGNKPSSYSNGMAGTVLSVLLGAEPTFTVSAATPTIDGSGSLHLSTTLSQFSASSDSIRRFAVYFGHDSTVSYINYDLFWGVIPSVGKTSATWDNVFNNIMKSLNSTGELQHFQSGDTVCIRLYPVTPGTSMYDIYNQKQILPVVNTPSNLVSVTLP